MTVHDINVILTLTTIGVYVFTFVILALIGL